MPICIVPVENSIRYSRKCSATLHLLDGDHRLIENIGKIDEYLGQFIRNTTSAKQQGRKTMKHLLILLASMALFACSGGDSGGSAEEAVDNAADTVEEAAGSAMDATEEAMDDAAQTAGDMADSAEDESANVLEATEAKLDAAADTAAEAMDDAMEAAEDTVDEATD